MLRPGGTRTPEMNVMKVSDNPAEHRFEIVLDEDGAVAAAYYQADDLGRRILTHTEVPFECGGQGIGSTLARAVFDDARARGLKLVLRCAFMADWYARHPDYADIVDG